MNVAMQLFTEAMDAHGIHYCPIDENALVMQCQGEHVPELKMELVFDDEEGTVSFYIVSLCHVPDDRLPAIYELCNTLNGKYRWTCFYVDEDHDVGVCLDALIHPDVCVNECMAMLYSLRNIVDSLYPAFAEQLS